MEEVCVMLGYLNRRRRLLGVLLFGNGGAECRVQRNTYLAVRQKSDLDSPDHVQEVD